MRSIATFYRPAPVLAKYLNQPRSVAMNQLQKEKLLKEANLLLDKIEAQIEFIEMCEAAKKQKVA